MLYTIPNPNYTLPKPCPFIITYPIHHPTFGTQSVTLCKYQHYPTLDIFLSLSFHSDTLPEYQPYPTNRRKNTPPYIEYLPHLLHQRQLSVRTCTHLTIPFITYPNLHFPPLYYCQGLIKYKAEPIYQIRPKLPRTETTQAKTTQAETTQGRNDPGLKQTTRACSCSCRTGKFMLSCPSGCMALNIVRVRIFWTSIIFVIIVFPYTHDTGAVTGTEPAVEFYTLALIEINIVAFQPFNTYV